MFLSDLDDRVPRTVCEVLTEDKQHQEHHVLAPVTGASGALQPVTALPGCCREYGSLLGSSGG